MRLVTRLRAEKFDVRIPAGTGKFLFFLKKKAWFGCGAHPCSYSIGTGA